MLCGGSESDFEFIYFFISKCDILDISATRSVQSHLQSFFVLLDLSGRVDLTVFCIRCSYIHTVQLQINQGL